MIMPAIWPKNAANTGRMMIIDTCSATRGSLTREEMIMLKLTAESAIRGPITNIAINQRVSRKFPTTVGLAIMIQLPMTNIAKPIQVAASAGMMAASDLPTNSWVVVMGVANNGSRLRLTFSPTIE